MSVETNIAVIMPAYNCRETIGRAIESVINQTYKSWHLYIINDASPQPIIDIVEGYTRVHNNITLINNEVNKGVAETRNVGLNESKEKIVAFLDSDDAWHPFKLENQLDKLDDFRAVVTAYNFISDKKKIIEYSKKSISLDEFLKKKFRVCFSSLIHYRVDGLYFQKVGHEDFLYIFNLMSNVGDLCVLKSSLVDYYDLDSSLSANKKKAASWHLNLLKNIFPTRLDKVFYYFMHYAINGMLFKIKNK